MTKSKKVIVVRVLLFKEDSIFLMLRNGKNSQGIGKPQKRWISPGGVLDEGETVQECLLRETQEEIGITLDTSKLKLIFEKYDPTFNADMVFYSYPYHGEVIKVLEPEKFDKVKWFKVSELSTVSKKDEHLGVYIEEAANAALIPVEKSNTIYHSWTK